MSEVNKNFFSDKALLLTIKILPFIVSVTLSMLLIESFTYPGFIRKNLLVDVRMLFVVSIFLSSVYIWSVNKLIKSSLLDLVFKCSYLLLPILLIIYYILVSLDANNYANYSYSTFHIQPDAFLNVVIYAITIAATGFLGDDKLSSARVVLVGKAKGNQKNINRMSGIFMMTALLLLAFFTVRNVIVTSNEIIKDNIYIYKNINDSYDDKMYKSWHLFYKLMSFIKKNTPENSVIAIPPPIRPWLSEGNSVLVRYFLFPRYISTVEDESSDPPKPQYFLVSKGLWNAFNEGDYGWPKDYIKASEIIYMDGNDYSVRVVKNVVFDPTLEINRYSYGLIKVAD